MKKRVLLRWVLFSTASISGLAMCGAMATLRSASAADPTTSASVSASALGSTAGSASVPVGPPKRELPIQPLDNQSIPTAVSPVPTLEDWKTATPVEVYRGSAKASNCVALLVREWLKVKCDMSVGAIYQHTGNLQGVAFWIRSTASNDWGSIDAANGGEMIFPLRVGDRRLLQFFELRHDSCTGVAFEPSIMVDETWLEGDAAPTVVLQ